MSDRPDLARQQGSAMFYSFIVTLLLFLASAYFAFAIFQDNEKLKQADAAWRVEKKKVDAELKLHEQYLEELAQVIGETGTYSGKEGFDWTDYGGQPAPLEDVVLAQRYESAVNTFLGEFGLPKDARQIASALNYVKNYVTQLKQQVQDQKDNASSLETRVAELQQQASQAASDRRRAESDLNRQITDQAERFQAQLEEAQTRTDAVNAQNAQLRSQLADEREARQTDAVAFNKRINTLTAQNSAFAAKLSMINPPDQADGTVLSANQAVSRAWVDIGRLDMLKLGTKFRIVDPQTGKHKANGIVTTLDDKRAELRITDLADRYQPVVAGDQIRNELYSPELRRNIYLMGRFSLPYSQPVVKAYLERIGNTVVDRLDVGVDLIIVGQDTINEEGDGYVPITETAEYKRGLELSIEFVRLNQIRDLLDSSLDGDVAVR
jgi:hypothetical protein